MTKTIKLDNEKSYLTDMSTGERVSKFDPANKGLQLTIDLGDSTLTIENQNIIQEYGDQIVVKYCDDKFIIDDDHQPVLVKAGYLVYRNYDNENIRDPEEGQKCTKKIITDAMEAYFAAVKEMHNIEQEKDNEQFWFDDPSGYRIYFGIDTITGIVAKNQLRKDNSLPFYPFDKKMDKYGTVYLTIFAEKLKEDAIHQDRYNASNSLIKYLVQQLGSDYHFVSQIIKRRVILAKGL